MDPSTKQKFGRTNLEVTAFGFGTAPIGNIFREIDEETSDAMIQAAWDSGIRYFDTAPMYGHGLSELRTGHSLHWENRDDFVRCALGETKENHVTYHYSSSSRVEKFGGRLSRKALKPS